MNKRAPAHIAHDDQRARPDQLTSLHRDLDEEQARTRQLLADLSVLDDFERALAAGSTDRPFYEGVNSIHRLLLAALREARAEPIESVGKRLEGELLRPARVVVAAPPGSLPRRQ
jgi:molecular chaperone GrpE (heat shock protein)